MLQVPIGRGKRDGDTVLDSKDRTHLLDQGDVVGCVALSSPAIISLRILPVDIHAISTCNKYAEATGGIGCSYFAAQDGITPAQLYAWNSVLGTSGENCGSSFWANEWYCVRVSG